MNTLILQLNDTEVYTLMKAIVKRMEVLEAQERGIERDMEIHVLGCIADKMGPHIILNAQIERQQQKAAQN